jgi:hypothetical protein
MLNDEGEQEAEGFNMNNKRNVLSDNGVRESVQL